MSHFTMLVILPPGYGEHYTDVEQGVKDALAPYSENLEVDPYLDKCWCVNTVADTAANGYANKHCAQTYGTIRDKYWALPCEERSRQKWERMIRPWNRLHDEHLKSHPLYKKANPECDDCRGTGFYQSTRNKEGYWDWYSIGGRWSGALADTDRYEDPENQEACHMCGGTGDRLDAEFYENGAGGRMSVKLTQDGARSKTLIKFAGVAVYAPSDVEEDLNGPEIGFGDIKASWVTRADIPEGFKLIEWCNGCDGKGTRVKWPSHWKRFDGDLMPVNQISTKFRPFGVVTPFPIVPVKKHRKRRIQKKWLKRYGYTIESNIWNPSWYTRGKMGWFAIVTGEQSDHRWNDFYATVKQLYPTNLGVLVDCHV